MQQIINSLVDDMDGGPADETVSFSVDQHDYVIDLSAGNASGLREALAPYVAVARKAGASGAKHRAQSGLRRNYGAAREWLSAHGWDVPRRGRLSAELLDAYEQRQDASGAVEEVVTGADSVSLVKEPPLFETVS